MQYMKTKTIFRKTLPFNFVTYVYNNHTNIIVI